MFDHLQIYERRERLLVGIADCLLRPWAGFFGTRGQQANGSIKNILVLRLERIGDLLMTLGALERLRATAPIAHIHLVVGSWNESLTRLLPWVDSYETLDVPWLARRHAGASWTALLGRAMSWRRRRFDLALNLEPDIRSNLLIGLSRARRRVGFSSAGGSAFLTTALAYQPGEHTAANTVRVVDAALATNHRPWTRGDQPTLPVSEDARRDAARLLAGAAAGNRPLVGIHASGGRVIKQWHMERFAEVAITVARNYGATIILTGTADERALVARVKALIPNDVPVLNVSGSMELPVFAAVLEQLRLFVTSDTGPMHLAAAVGTPTVALFGPSDPTRYGPLNDNARVTTADLWCRPCNRVRRPPERCTHGVPDCLSGITTAMVIQAANDVLPRGDRRNS